jgi:hypothetical protein
MDTQVYYSVDEVTLTFAVNGCSLSFWGRKDPEGLSQKFTMVFPTVELAFETIRTQLQQ